MLRNLATAACLLALVDLAAAQNVLVILSDDQGTDSVRCYGGDVRTPRIDQLAAGGVRFARAYSNPVCSPTRGVILTGRYGFRTGIGDIFSMYDRNASTDPESGEFLRTLQEGEDTLADRAGRAGLESAAFGKWHLNDVTDDLPYAPMLRGGFDAYSGALGNIGATSSDETYFHWYRDTNGSQAWTTEYATTATAREAASWINGRDPDSRWICYVAFNAGHAPFHVAPDHLTTYTEAELGRVVTPLEMYRTMIEAMDTEIGHLLDGIGYARRSDVTVVFLGDNGTPAAVSSTPAKAKGSLFEPGIHVPLIVSGAKVTGRGECGALVGAVDVFRTALDLGGVPVAGPATIDSVSLLPYLTSPGAASRRTYVFSEQFNPDGYNGASDGQRSQRAVRNDRFKLIRIEASDTSTSDQFYDLVRDPTESTNLLPMAPADPRRKAYEALSAQLESLLASK